MKRIILLVLSLALIFSVSCSKKNEILGKWLAEEYSEELCGNVKLVYEFSENNKLYVSPVNSENIESTILFGEYEISGDKIKVISDEGTAEYTFSVSDGALTLKCSDGTDIIFEKMK